jgi:ribosomal protein S18 acetylase RimI-like enzyme
VSLAGRDLAVNVGATHHHSEHALTLPERRAETPADAALHLREATTRDIPALSRLFLDGFGEEHLGGGGPLVDRRTRTLMIDRADETIGTLRATLEGDRGRVYGFVVAAEWRGRGIGREALQRACGELFDAGAHSVELEVEVANDRALGLYTSVGFEPTATEDYYELPLASPGSA